MLKTGVCLDIYTRECSQLRKRTQDCHLRSCCWKPSGCFQLLAFLPAARPHSSMVAMVLHYQNIPLLQKDQLGTQRGWKMLPDRNRFSAPTVTFEGQFPLGPFPRHIWIHNNTPQDSLDEACHEIWKRVQRLSEELQPLSLVPPLQHAPCSDLAGTLQRDTIDSQSK